jgi:hypothetical protein
MKQTAIYACAIAIGFGLEHVPWWLACIAILLLTSLLLETGDTE